MPRRLVALNEREGHLLHSNVVHTRHILAYTTQASFPDIAIDLYTPLIQPRRYHLGACVNSVNQYLKQANVLVPCTLAPSWVYSCPPPPPPPLHPPFPCRNKPNLLFFDLTRCASAISLTDLLNGDLDTSELFTCPTPQVPVIASLVARLYLGEKRAWERG